MHLSPVISLFYLVRLTILCCILTRLVCSAKTKAVWAINAGAGEHTDVNGVFYKADPLDVGTASDYGRKMLIRRVGPVDQVLYQTERYHVDSFAYEIPLVADGSYVLVLKFCEVWFAANNQKIFNVLLNGVPIIERLDIHERVGRGVAHDEYIEFNFRGNMLLVKEQEVPLGQHPFLKIEFQKTSYDNPKVNAIVLYKGTIDEVPHLGPLDVDSADRPANQDEEEPETDEDEEETGEPARPANTNGHGQSRSYKRTSGPRAVDPYAADQASSAFWPVFVAIGCFVPVTFFLCRL